MRHRFFIRTIAVVSWLLFSVGIAKAQTISAVPGPNGYNNYPAKFLAACQLMEEWPAVLSHTSELGTYFADLKVDTWDDELEDCFYKMNQQGLTLTIEIGSYKPGVCGGGYGCFSEAEPVLNRLINLGAPPIRLRMDEPLVASRNASGNDGDAVNEVVTWLWYMQYYFPSIAISDIEAFPFISALDLQWWMAALASACGTAGVACPDTFEVDHDRSDINWTWSSISAIEGYAHYNNMDFGYILGSPATQTNWGNTAVDTAWYLDGEGIVPDRYVFQSWESADPTSIPDEDAYYDLSGPLYYTFMSIIKRTIYLGYTPW